jgi:hypothetical protein
MSIPAIFGRAAPKCAAGSKACAVGGCPKMKSVLQAMPPTACPPPKKKPTTKTGRALEIASDLLERAVSGRAAPKKPAPAACSPSPSPAPKPAPAPTKVKPCTGKKCKRDGLEQPGYGSDGVGSDPSLGEDDFGYDSDGVNSDPSLEGDDFVYDTTGVFQKTKRALVDFVKRVTKKVDMDDAKAYDWKAGDQMETTGISVCSVLVVYTKDKIGMAHIPQGRIVGNTYMPGQEVVTDLTTKLGTAFGRMTGATAVLYHHPSLDAERVTQVRNWAIAQGVTPQVVPFSATISGSGTFNIQRFGDAWPPHLSGPI